MDGTLVWTLVWTVSVHPSYVHRKRVHADQLHRLVLDSGVDGLTRETHLCGLMEVLSSLSESILFHHGYATHRRCFQSTHVDRYYPLRIQALALERTRAPRVPLQ